MKKGDVVDIIQGGPGGCWAVRHTGYDSLHYYADFEDNIGIFLEVLDEKYSLVLFGDKKIACWSSGSCIH